MNRFYELDKSITREVMQEFKGQTVDSICPDCKGETSPKVGEVVLYKYTHHLNRRSTMEIIKEGIMVGIGSKKKMFLADHPERIGIVKFNGLKQKKCIEP
jgi:hypothetical protein